ncbi:MAG: phosphatidate cytidylyltransferase [Chlamydiota bacterium]
MKNLKDIGKRLWVSTLSILLIGLMIGFSSYPIMKGIILITFMGVASVAMWEYIQLVKAKQILLSIPLLISSSVLLIGAFFCAAQFPFFIKLPIFLFFVLLFFIFLTKFGSIENSIEKMALSSFGLLYTTIPIGMLLMILFSNHGVFWFIYLIAITKVTDAAAYFGGRLLGKTPLCAISPKKTLEGAFIGFVVAILISLLFSYSPFLTWKEALILGIFIGSIGQIGDLAESLLKRDAKVKDSNTIPGLGGILDMVDSLLFTIPILFFFL